MSRGIAGEDEVREAIRAAYQFEQGYPDHASINRIVGAIGTDGAGPENRGRLLTLIAAVAVIALGLVAIGTLLSIPRGTAPTPAGVAPSGPRTLPVPQAALSIGVGAGTIRFQAHQLPPGSRVDITVTQAAISTEFVAVADGHGDAQASAADPGLASGFADSSICITPAGRSSIAYKCISLRVQVPARDASSATTTQCPPGSREVGQSTPGSNESYWVSCFSTTSRPQR